ncbi:MULTISPECIES: hypothetical protein [unclassified Microcoleus]|nr:MULTISPECIES: hypothetical protein [unclassified Microcoleus]
MSAEVEFGDRPVANFNGKTCFNMEVISCRSIDVRLARAIAPNRA